MEDIGGFFLSGMLSLLAYEFLSPKLLRAHLEFFVPNLVHSLQFQEDCWGDTSSLKTASYGFF